MVDVVIIDPNWLDIVQDVAISKGIIAKIATQAKEVLL